MDLDHSPTSPKVSNVESDSRIAVDPLAVGEEHLDTSPVQSSADTFTSERVQELAREFRAAMHLAAWGVTGNYDDAEDAVQEALIDILGRPIPCSVDKMRGYLCGVAGNKAVDLIRSKGRKLETPNRGGPITSEDSVPHNRPYRPPTRPAEVAAKDNEPPKPLNQYEDEDVFESPVLALLLERLKNRPAVLRALQWALASDPAKREQRDLAESANITPAAVSMSLKELYTETLRAYQDWCGELPSVRMRRKLAKSIVARSRPQKKR